MQKKRRSAKTKNKHKGESMTFKSKARRAGWLLVVAAFAFGIVAAIHPPKADAYGLIGTRSIQMSSDVSGATNTIYKVSFKTASALNLGAIVVQFCANNPIIGDTCSTTPTVPVAFLNTNFNTLSVNNWSAGALPQFTLNTSANGSNSNTVVLTKSTAPSPVAANQTISFELGNGSTNGITNPANSNVTFFARITLYSSNTVGSDSSCTVHNIDFSTDTAAQCSEKDNNILTDAGGTALSTANALNVTAKVQEALTFCLYTGANCAAGGNAINLGDSNGVLADMTTVYTNSTPKFDIASNALNGVAVRMKGDTLTSGTFTITADGASCTQDSTATNTEQFGVRIVSYGTGQYNGDATQANQTPDAGIGDYGCLAGYHKFDTANTNTTYGSLFATTIGATDISTTNFELAAKAANTTEAGVYKSTLQFIATATY